MQYTCTLVATNYQEFEACLVRILGGGLMSGEVARIELAGKFDDNWDLLEEAQMRARLEGLPDEYWATLRWTDEVLGTIHLDVLRLKV